ncbi:MAG: S66 peptidase family protein [Christensenellales bacterium]|jgi:muramoyltetrapeptide carboxypeptidase
MIAPQLRYGDTIGIISPSHVADRAFYAQVIGVLEGLGFAVKTGANLYRDTYGYLASEQERADDLNQMVADPAIKLILFGGGEGGNELLPLIDYEAIAEHPKRFLSYSDGTTILNAIHARCALVTYYGQGAGGFADLRHYDYCQFATQMLAPNATGAFVKSGPWRTLEGGAGQGVLIGGYTANFALMLGGAYLPLDLGRDYLLFLESHERFSGVAEVSAYLSHIEQSPLIDRVRGLIFGHYSLQPNAQLMDRLARFGRKHRVPVVACDDFGHGVNHAILPIGQTAKLDADGQRLTFC